jgi:hypothetical protein
VREMLDGSQSCGEPSDCPVSARQRKGAGGAAPTLCTRFELG